ncbi:MAG: hypothetical protein QM754_16210 [Tepidisphaeraceae bacterium]
MNTAPTEDLDMPTVEKHLVTIGTLASIASGLLFVIAQTVGVCLYVGTMQRQIDTIATKQDAAQVQRELTLRNRDLQIDSLKTDVDRVSKRQDATDATLADLVRKMERVLVISESIDKRLNGKP